jgi:hypothetical protein
MAQCEVSITVSATQDENLGLDHGAGHPTPLFDYPGSQEQWPENVR